MSTPTIYAAAATRTPARLSNPRPADAETRKTGGMTHYHQYPDEWRICHSANGIQVSVKVDAAAIDRRRIRQIIKTTNKARLYINS